MNSQESYSVSEKEKLRLTNAQQLGVSGDSSVSSLLAMLTDSSWVVRRAVVESLANLGDVAVGPLCESLRTQRDNEARIAAAVDALVASKGRPEDALQKLAADPNPAVITDALQVFGRRKSKSAIPTLIALTKHENDIVAVGAIEALGRIGGRSAVEALIDTVRTGNFFRTFPAIDILGRSSDRRVIEPLTELLQNSTYLPEAARALGRTGDRAAVLPLIDLLKSATDSVVRIAAVSLWDLREGFLEKSDGTVTLVDDLLRAKVTSENIRRICRTMSSLGISESIYVCKLLGVIGSPEATPALAAKLGDTPVVAESAAEALKKIGVQSDLHLVQAIREGDSSKRKVLLPIVTRTASAIEVANCLNDEDPEVRALACETVARLGNVNIVADVFKLLSDTNLRVVHAATAALQALGSQESRQLAIEASHSESPIVRRAALRILAYFGDSGSLQPILKGLTDADPRVREVAIQGLPYLEAPAAYSALCQSARDTEPRTRALAMRSLSHAPKVDERTYSILLMGITDSDAWVRYYACQSLGRLGYSPASIEIAGLVDDEAGQVRVSAVEALSQMESREAHRALQRAAISSEPDVQRAALVGLGISRRIEDLPIVLNAANSEDVSTRLIALSAMVSFTSPLVLGALSSAALDTDEQVRATAIGFLAARPEAEATEVLIELLSQEVTQAKAKTALLVSQVTRASGILIALNSADDELATILVSILLRLPRPDAKRALVSAMKLENVAARKAAAASLAINPDAEKIAALRDAAENDPNPGIREICVLLLNE